MCYNTIIEGQANGQSVSLVKIEKKEQFKELLKDIYNQGSFSQTMVVPERKNDDEYIEDLLEKFSKLSHDDNNCFGAIKYGDKLVGIAGIIDGEFNIAIKDSHSRVGIATELIDFGKKILVQFFDKDGNNEVKIQYLSYNARVRKLAQGLGFGEFEEIKWEDSTFSGDRKRANHIAISILTKEQFLQPKCYQELDKSSNKYSEPIEENLRGLSPGRISELRLHAESLKPNTAFILSSATPEKDQGHSQSN